MIAERSRSAPENYHPYNNWPEKSNGGHLHVSEYKLNIINFVCFFNIIN